MFSVIDETKKKRFLFLFRDVDLEDGSSGVASIRGRRSPLRRGGGAEEWSDRGRWDKVDRNEPRQGEEEETTEKPGEEEEEEEEAKVHVVSWRWDHMGVYVTITLFIVLSGLAKVGECRFIVGWEDFFSS